MRRSARSLSRPPRSERRSTARANLHGDDNIDVFETPDSFATMRSQGESAGLSRRSRPYTPRPNPQAAPAHGLTWLTQVGNPVGNEKGGERNPG